MLPSEQERFIDLRATIYYYQDIRIHLQIDRYEKKNVTYPKWDAAEKYVKDRYLRMSRKELIKEGKINP